MANRENTVVTKHLSSQKTQTLESALSASNDLDQIQLDPKIWQNTPILVFEKILYNLFLIQIKENRFGLA